VITAFGCPSQTNVGQVVTCSASVSDGSPWFIEGVAPDGAQIVGDQSVIFSSAGQYIVSITCAGCSAVQAVVTVTVALPTATLTCPSSATSGESFTCDVAVTGAATWNVTAPSGAEPSITIIDDQTVSVTLFGSDTYPVTLQACNSVGQCATATQNVVVTAVALPTAALTCPSSATSDESFTCDVAVTGATTWEVTAPVDAEPLIVIIDDQTVSVTLTGSDTYPVTLRACNSVGQCATATQNVVVTVTVASPTATLKCPSSVTFGESFICDVAVTGAATWGVTAPIGAEPSIEIVDDQTVAIRLFGLNTYAVVLQACNSVGQCVTATQNVAVVANMQISSFAVTDRSCASPSLMRVTVDWGVSGDPAGTVALQRRPSGSGQPFATIQSFSVGSNQFVDVVSNSQSWDYRVVATNSLGKSATSSTAVAPPLICIF
jgi:hypothetical protein